MIIRLNQAGLLVVLCSWLGLGAFPSSAQDAAICTSQLRDSIDAVLNRPELRRTRWGVLVQSLGDPQPLYSHNAEQYFVPASNVKLLTTAAALEQLGPDFRIRTSIYHRNFANQQTLYIVGRGDPSLTDEDLVSLAQQLRERGITTVDRLIGDDSYFQGDSINPTWEWEDIQAGYGAPVNSLILNQNAIGLTVIPQALGQPLAVRWDDPAESIMWQVQNRSTTVPVDATEFLTVGRDLSRSVLYVHGQLRVGSASEPVAVSVPQPAQRFMQRFVQILVTQGIQVRQTIVTTQFTDPQGLEIAAVESPPLSELLVETNRESNNLYAEVLLRSLGKRNEEATSTLEAGIAALEMTFNGWGINPDSYALVDGSGLSRHNLVSPEAIVQTLQIMARSSNASTYRHSLALAGVNGTLQNRFRQTLVEQKLRGKTGQLRNAMALSGYLELGHQSALVFSLLVNPFHQAPSQVQTSLDAIVEQLAQVRSC
ncbi:D-alanyl-D-alanine carboxypeptidase/D-alanyl-D-alanine endopeptidase [Thermocoleostomius sinensis]|uniref:D-alanyl-D-alanine carboxypeptidase/D-alanyl-D-alanine-endopeptidase n=1 Tax=Thermocoleostomius sinensis A174 TaxID=2016057 RepID=A0A9E8Z8X9_9CYAN|nr:D-alanyl-D-alanine carboxypeptidase/D-alanyl-D-alanine-endopeptidase [Thermocoleostomius sinensis]WAL58690.1 D-alanyl-D-alanine carboxypeptidase/D-alanyl-D-alanine-endopeptidase [Thermocoleostomius sinensis A174]